jgi:hypothetical protein
MIASGAFSGRARADPARSGLRREPRCCLRAPAGHFLAEGYINMRQSHAHRLVGAALLFYARLAWRRKQAIEIDPMLAAAGWVAGELRPPK